MFTKRVLSTTIALAILMSNPINAATTNVKGPIAPLPQASHETIILTATQVADGVYRANVGGTNAVLTIASGRPVGYKYGNYRARQLSMKGNTIHIDKALLQITGLNSKTIVGIFSLNGESREIRFTR